MLTARTEVRCYRLVPVERAAERDAIMNHFSAACSASAPSCLFRALPGRHAAPANGSWRYLKGRAEASSPDRTAWRQVGFPESGWTTGGARSGPATSSPPRHAADGHAQQLHQPVPARDVHGGRRGEIGTLELATLSDDGCLAWINGQEVLRYNMPNGWWRLTARRWPPGPSPSPG